MCLRVFICSSEPLKEVPYQDLEQEFGIVSTDLKDPRHFTAMPFSYEALSCGGCGCAFDGQSKESKRARNLLTNYLSEMKNSKERISIVTCWGYFEEQPAEKSSIQLQKIKGNTFKKTIKENIIQIMSIAE